MTQAIQVGPVHHAALTVTDLKRSVDFYTSLFNFKVVLDMGTRVLMHNGSMVLAVTLPPDPSQALPGDCFNENRVGLDHLSFGVDSIDTLKNAVRLFDERGIPHGELKDLGDAMRLYVMAFRDPDNIQVELTAHYG